MNPEHHRSASTAGKRDVTKLAAALAPPEEQNPQAAGLYPAGKHSVQRIDEPIVVDARNVSLPDTLLTDKKFNPWRPPPVVVTIVAACLLFIAFIAWQISKMPAK